jgi:hypothetical protein
MAHYLFNFVKAAAAKGSPLRDQAGKLLEMKLWGVGPKAPLRDGLAPGDLILAYVGAPEKLFIGQATVARGFHEWTPEEAIVYGQEAGGHGFPAGVTFGDTEAWSKPVPIDSVWSGMPASKTNPNHVFLPGIVRIKEEDFEIVVSAAGGDLTPATPTKPAISTSPEAETMADRLFAATEKLKGYLATSHPKGLSEAATRAMFIDGYVAALGYTDFDDVEFGVPVMGDEADYVLNVDEKEAIVIEAKKLDASLGQKEAAQVVKYASVLGTTRWGLLTNGRTMKLYDCVPKVPIDQRLVFEIDLADYQDREDFEVKVYPDVSLMSKKSMKEGTGLTRRAAQQAISDLLAASNSAPVKALTKELSESGLAHLSADEVVELLSELLS